MWWNGCVRRRWSVTRTTSRTCEVNELHVQGKQVARARQTGRTCKANRSHVQGRQVYACFMIQSLVKVILIFINRKMRFPWLLFAVYHSVIFLTEFKALAQPSKWWYWSLLQINPLWPGEGGTSQSDSLISNSLNFNTVQAKMVNPRWVMFSKIVSSKVGIVNSVKICLSEILDLIEVLFQNNYNSCLFRSFRFLESISELFWYLWEISEIQEGGSKMADCLKCHVI